MFRSLLINLYALSSEILVHVMPLCLSLVFTNTEDLPNSEIFNVFLKEEHI